MEEARKTLDLLWVNFLGPQWNSYFFIVLRSALNYLQLKKRIYFPFTGKPRVPLYISKGWP